MCPWPMAMPTNCRGKSRAIPTANHDEYVHKNEHVYRYKPQQNMNDRCPDMVIAATAKKVKKKT